MPTLAHPCGKLFAVNNGLFYSCRGGGKQMVDTEACGLPTAASRAISWLTLLNTAAPSSSKLPAPRSFAYLHRSQGRCSLKTLCSVSAHALLLADLLPDGSYTVYYEDAPGDTTAFQYGATGQLTGSYHLSRNDSPESGWFGLKPKPSRSALRCPQRAMLSLHSPARITRLAIESIANRQYPEGASGRFDLKFYASASARS